MSDQIDWGSLKTAAIAIGSVNEAAKRAASDLPPEEAERFRERVNKRAFRERWLEKAEVLELSAPTNAKPLSKAVQSGSELLTKVLQDDARETKLSLSKGVRRAAKWVENQAEPVLFAGADKVRQLVASASTLHGWEEKQQAGNGLVNVTLIRVELPTEQQAKAIEIPS